ncbi:hypothetical protein A6A25_22360 [Saccharothrix sp. CB00851]|nr:hypothetical protein A6A25_22360 [Saccharothrix sp. CB00851]
MIMSNEPSRPDDDVPTGAAAGDPAARPDVPPADADRIAASRDAAESAGEQRLSTPASTGLGSGSTGPDDATPEPGEGARERAVEGNEPVTPAGPTAVTGARPAPSADPVASAEPASQAPAANETRGSGGNGRKVLIALLVLLLIAIVAFGVYFLTRGSANAEVGDCVSVTAENDNRADVETLDCSADKASYKVGKVLESTDSTCSEDGIYTEIVPAGGVGDGYRLCLLPNMVEGACYKADEGSGFVKTGCTGNDTFKVIRVIKDVNDLEACPDGAGMAYPEPPVTYCLGLPEM